MELPSSASLLLDHLCSTALDEHAPAYFLLDRLGRIHQWGGNLRALGISSPKTGDAVSALLDFMEGILPLKGQSIDFSCIQRPDAPSLDARIFKTDDGYGLIVWNPGKKDVFSALDPIFQALNFAVLEMNADGHFVLLGTPPPWIEHLSVQTGKCISPEAVNTDVFSFLEQFIQEIRSRWSSHQQGSFKSGIWTLKDNSNQELLFEATALQIYGRKLLIISHDVCHPSRHKDTNHL